MSGSKITVVLGQTVHSRGCPGVKQKHPHWHHCNNIRCQLQAADWQRCKITPKIA